MLDLPARRGPRPAVSTEGPQRQLDDRTPPELWGRLWAGLLALPGVVEGHSQVSPPSSRALFLPEVTAVEDPAASLAPPGGRPEPAHLHGVEDTSLHLCLPSDLAARVRALGWGEPHAYADHDTQLLVYGPRDDHELEVVTALVAESLAFARAARTDAHAHPAP